MVGQLLRACHKMDVREVRELLKGGADIEESEHGNTPLLFTSWFGAIELSKLLIEKGANIEAKDNNGDTPIILASLSGFFDTVELLVERGADMEVKGKNGHTPLFWSLWNKNFK